MRTSLIESLSRLQICILAQRTSKRWHLFSEDVMIWEYAKANNFVITSKDADFHQRSLLYGHPPKFIYLRVGNRSTSRIVQILRDNYATISQFGNAQQESILVLA